MHASSHNPCPCCCTAIVPPSATRLLALLQRPGFQPLPPYPGSPALARRPRPTRATSLCRPQQARHSYTAADIRMNESFVPIELKLKGDRLGIDFSGFDATTTRAALATGGAEEVNGDFARFLVPVPPGAGAGAVVQSDAAGGVMAAALSDGLHSHMQELRSRSIRTLSTTSASPVRGRWAGAGPGTGGSSAFAPAGAGAGALHPLAQSPQDALRELCEAVLCDPAAGLILRRQALIAKEGLGPGSAAVGVGVGSVAADHHGHHGPGPYALPPSASGAAGGASLPQAQSAGVSGGGTGFWR